MSKYYDERTVLSQLTNLSLSTVPGSIHILMEKVSARPGSGIKSVSGDELLLEVLGLELTTPPLHHISSQFPPRKVMRSHAAAHFLVGAAEVVDTPSVSCTASYQWAL